MEEEKDNMKDAQAGAAAGNAGGAPATTPVPGGHDGGAGNASADAAPEGEDEESSVIEMLATVPGAVRDYLMGDHIADVRNAIYDAHKLDEEDREIALDSELGVFFGTVDVEDFPDLVWQRLGWDQKEEKRAIALVLDILGKVILPAAAFVGDVVAVILDLGGDPDSYGAKPIEMRQVAYADGADAIAKTTGMDKDLDEAMRKRLRHIIESRLRDVRDENETMRMLTKPKKTGGMELSEARAQEILDVVNSESRMNRYVEEVIGTVHTEHEANVPAAPHKDFKPEEIRAIYLGSAEEQKDLVKKIEALSTEVGDDEDALRLRLYDALYPSSLEPPDRSEVLSVLLLDAQRGKFLDTVIDPRFRDISDKFLEENPGPLKNAVEATPAGREGMNLFLQLVLRGFAGMDENDSARYGLRITNLLKKQGEARYEDLAAFDLDKGEFAWTEPVEL